MSVAVPTVHLNGTSREALVEENMKALAAVHAAFEAVRGAAPNARDYYVQSSTAFNEARKQHVERLLALTAIEQQLTTIILAIR